MDVILITIFEIYEICVQMFKKGEMFHKDINLLKFTFVRKINICI